MPASTNRSRKVKGPLSKKRKSKEQPIAFVLWGEGGEEVSAAIFIKELRESGVQVKLVGLGSTRIKGEAGLVFVPDVTLGQALEVVHRAALVVLPFGGQTLRRFTNDPRLEQFIGEAHAQGVTFVQSADAADSANLSMLFDSNVCYRVIVYPVGEALHGFIEDESSFFLCG